MAKKTTTKQSATMTKWLAGEIDSEGLTQQDVDGPIRLRLLEAEGVVYVQTTHGATQELEDVKKGLPEVLKALRGDPEDEASVEMGEYCAEIFPARGAYIKVQCHDIDGAEVERIAAVIKAFKPGETKIFKA